MFRRKVNFIKVDELKTAWISFLPVCKLMKSVKIAVHMIKNAFRIECNIGFICVHTLVICLYYVYKVRYS